MAKRAGARVRADVLSKKLKKLRPAAAHIRWTCRHGRIQEGVAISLGESLSQVWQSGNVIVFWDDGDHTALYDEQQGDIRPDTEIEFVGWIFYDERDLKPGEIRFFSEEDHE